MERVVTTNAAEVVKVMSSFYMEAFREIDEDFGFDLTRLVSVRTVLSDG